jgi:hypothetical protein
VSAATVKRLAAQWASQQQQRAGNWSQQAQQADAWRAMQAQARDRMARQRFFLLFLFRIR